MSTRITKAALLAAVVALTLGTTAATAAATSVTHDRAAAQVTSRKTVGMVLNVVNNSTHDLRWGGSGTGDTPTSAPKAIIPANGGTDRLVYASNLGIVVSPTWVVDGTTYTINPVFGVLLVGPNTTDCTADNIDKGSPVGPTHCDIGHGWDPDAHVTFTDLRAAGVGAGHGGHHGHHHCRHVIRHRHPHTHRGDRAPWGGGL